eukprot:2419721-Rhodomonas_salina.1
MANMEGAHRAKAKMGRLCYYYLRYSKSLGFRRKHRNMILFGQQVAALATGLRIRYAKSGTEQGVCCYQGTGKGHFAKLVARFIQVSPYALAMGCPAAYSGESREREKGKEKEREKESGSVENPVSTPPTPGPLPNVRYWPSVWCYTIFSTDAAVRFPMSGTDAACGATLCVYAVSGTDSAYGATRVNRRPHACKLVRRYQPLLWSYALPTRCPVLVYCTVLRVWYWHIAWLLREVRVLRAYGAMRSLRHVQYWHAKSAKSGGVEGEESELTVLRSPTVLRVCCAVSGTDTAYATTHFRSSQQSVRNSLVRFAIGLRACYAMPGTAVAYAAICLCACYAMPGTDLVYLATSEKTEEILGEA